MSTSSIAVDRSLREVFSILAKQLARTGEVPLADAIILKQGTAVVRTSGNMRFSVERSFAGFNWRMEVGLDDLQGLINGMTREWPMERLSKCEDAELPLTDDAVSKILGSLGFSAPPPEANAAADSEDTEDGAAEDPTKGDRPLTGLEEDIEADADFGSVSESDLDAFLAAYDSATVSPKAQKPEGKEDETTKGEEAPDPFSALVASLIAGEHDDEIDALDDDDEVDELAIQSARSFVDLLLKNEKLELVESADPEILAIELAPLLDEEMKASKKADAVMDWLLDQDAVDDVYLSDDEMISILRHW